MDDSLVLDTPMVQGHASLRIASLMEDRLAPAAPTRRRATMPLSVPPMVAPSLPPAEAESIDDVLDLSILMPFDVDWQAMDMPSPVDEPKSRPQPRRLTSFERHRLALDERLQQVRSRVQDVQVRVAMLRPE